MLRISIIIAAVASASLAAPAAAETGQMGSSSSASSTFRVYIPPLAASLQAAENGAVGLWTVEGREQGLLISLDRDESRSPKSVTVYSRRADGIEFRWSGARNASRPVVAGDFNGLSRKTFSMPQTASPVEVFTLTGI